MPKLDTVISKILDKICRHSNFSIDLIGEWFSPSFSFSSRRHIANLYTHKHIYACVYACAVYVYTVSMYTFIHICKCAHTLAHLHDTCINAHILTYSVYIHSTCICKLFYLTYSWVTKLYFESTHGKINIHLASVILDVTLASWLLQKFDSPYHKT